MVTIARIQTYSTNRLTKIIHQQFGLGNLAGIIYGYITYGESCAKNIHTDMEKNMLHGLS